MVIAHFILAGLAIAAVAWRPRSGTCAVLVAGAAALDLALGASADAQTAVGRTVVPLAAFLAAALALAGLVRRSGLVERAARALAIGARGDARRLYWLVCGGCALLTATLSLDGAIVLAVPVLLALQLRWSAPLRPLLLGRVGL